MNNEFINCTFEPAPQVTRKTFYVLRNTAWGGPGEFTKMLKSGGPSSLSHHTVDDATQYGTLADAVAAQKTAVALGFGSYEIVMVSRSVTKGVLKSPAKTVRRIVQDGEVVPLGAKWAVKNPYAGMGEKTPSMWDGRASIPATAQLHNAALFESLDDLLIAAVEHGTSFPAARKGTNRQDRWIVRVVEETVPEVRTEDVVKDILTPLP